MIVPAAPFPLAIIAQGVNLRQTHAALLGVLPLNALCAALMIKPLINDDILHFDALDVDICNCVKILSIIFP